MQIYQEMQGFFPHNKVEYYVSYFDYYQPEAYKPESNTYISKKVQRNASIAKMRLKTLNSLVTDDFVIVVASVAAIYGCSDPNSYREVVFRLTIGEEIKTEKILAKLDRLGYQKGQNLDVVNDDKVQQIERWNKQIGDKVEDLPEIAIPPAQDYAGAAVEEKLLTKIRQELAERKEELVKAGKFLEAERLEVRTSQDLQDFRDRGFCPGIENYARYFDGRQPGETPFTLLDYFPEGFLTIIDESHITIPQVRAMYNTDRRRKETLVKYGFRLPSALDNRPLNEEEFFKKLNYTLYVSATPGNFEMAKVNHQPVEQIIRPTGLLDPEIEVRSSVNQIADIMREITEKSSRGEKVLIYALTIVMSEQIASYLREKDIRVVYLHSRLEIFERYQAITSLRRGVYDVIVGINLLKEGIDLPEVSLVCILDADKPGFLRDTRSLIQIIGRASRNKSGKVILYADEKTKNMLGAIQETNRRRQIQEAHNLQNNIVPQTIQKPVKDIVLDPTISVLVEKAQRGEMSEKELSKLRKNLRRQMKKSTREFRFDRAIVLRDALLDLEKTSELRNQLSEGGPKNAVQVIKLKKQLFDAAPNLLALDQEVNDLLSRLPNLPNCDIPSLENKIVAKTEYSHDIEHRLTHEKILGKLALIDEKKSILLSGSKFAVYQGFGSQLLHALINFMLAENQKKGYHVFDTPYLVNSRNLYNTGQFHKFQDNLYKLEDSDFYLLPTAEVSLVNLYQSQILTEEELPLNLCAYSPCFRAERMAAGRENKGLIRLHQFHKVELVKIVKPENSRQELEALVADARHLLHSLKISHRVVELCCEELGFSAAKTYDIEVWLPASKKWLEISSCSNCEDFQSRRAQIRVKNQESGKYYPHTLNGSALAVDRLISALCEYYYNEEENKLQIPEVLRKYFFTRVSY
ncbi:3938_t:CDS:2, partial [Gigaspora margarita]